MNNEKFDQLKYDNLTRACQSYDTFLAFCETQEEWDTIMQLFHKINDEHLRMAKEKGITPVFIRLSDLDAPPQ